MPLRVAATTPGGAPPPAGGVVNGPDGSATRRLVEALWDASPHPEDLDAARRLLLDHIAVAAWGSDLEAGRIMRRHAREDLTYGGPHLPLVGAGGSASAIAAAMANAVAASCYEYDDSHTGASVHPGSVIFPAALAASVLAGSDPATFLRAVVVGYEVMCRVGRAVNPPAHRARHFHPTATTGHFGAAAAAAVCYRLDVDTTVAALTLSGTVAGGSMQFLPEGGWTKQVHPAFAVQRGVHAAQLAARGFPGVRDPIAGERAFLAAQSEEPRPELLLADLGRGPSEIRQTGIKPYPSCRNSQSPADALLALRREHGVRPEEVESIRFGLIRPGIVTVAEPAEAKRRPTTLVEAQFSMPFVAAVALMDGELTPRQFEPARFADPATRALMDRVECVHDPELDRHYPGNMPAWVSVTTTDGRTLAARASDPRGDPANPLSDEELREKFRVLTGGSYPGPRAEAIIGSVARLPGDGSLGELLAGL